jgi:DNA-binding phage protein
MTSIDRTRDIPFKTTPDQVLRLASIVVEMGKAGIDHQFIADIQTVAQQDQGAFDLMEMWSNAGDAAERDEIVADLDEILDDYCDAPPAPLQKPYVHFDNLDGVAAQVVEYKKRLRNLIDQNGGVVAVAQMSGIPQPSLSRMLNNASMPRKTTLYRIANAIGVDESAIVAEWTR